MLNKIWIHRKSFLSADAFISSLFYLYSANRASISGLPQCGKAGEAEPTGEGELAGEPGLTFNFSRACWNNSFALPLSPPHNLGVLYFAQPSRERARALSGLAFLALAR